METIGNTGSLGTIGFSSAQSVLGNVQFGQVNQRSISRGCRMGWSS